MSVKTVVKKKRYRYLLIRFTKIWCSVEKYAMDTRNFFLLSVLLTIMLHRYRLLPVYVISHKCITYNIHTYVLYYVFVALWHVAKCRYLCIVLYLNLNESLFFVGRIDEWSWKKKWKKINNSIFIFTCRSATTRI